MNQHSFMPGKVWPDNRGVHINAHGGGVLFHQGIYFWFGEHKIEGPAGNAAHVGVHCYSSTDLYSWKDEGIALQVSDDPASDITKGCVLERPKVIYNAKTERFVMWFHLELVSQGYRAARSGIAIATQPAGPYTFLRSVRANAGHWPRNVRPDQMDSSTIDTARAAGDDIYNGENDQVKQTNVLGRDFEVGQQARDMTLFMDDDGKAYHVYSSEHNSTLHIAELSEDFLSHSGRYVRLFEHRWMEAPAICKRRGKYYFIGSGCTCWDPNAARSATAESIWGPWTEVNNPCIGVNPTGAFGPEKTFGGQSTFILPVHGREDAYIAIFDLWRPDNAIDGRYIWLPVRFEKDNLSVAWENEWDLSVFD